MELFSIQLSGYRRFKRTSTLRTNGKLVALLGPNEAGKSSLLHALSQMNVTGAFAAQDVTRGKSQDTLSVEARYLLSEAEIEKAGLSAPRWMTVEKRVTGKRYIGFIPPAPLRDISHRAKAAHAFTRAIEEAPMRSVLEETEAGTADEIERLLVDLTLASTDLGQKEIAQLRSRQTFLESVPKPKRTPNFEVALSELATLVSLEVAPNPTVHAMNTLLKEVPDFLLFGEEERNLASSYVIGDLRGAVPPALAGLAEIAALDLDEVFAAVDAGDNARITTLERRANRHLEARFKEAWRQTGVSVAIRLSASLLEIQVVNEGEEFTGLDERSDGLRQFVALQAFAMKSRSKAPVLLIDEAEQRLHYDAQADLVQMLGNQSVAPKVIYTTHSAGCLPEDLGQGVRLISPDPEDATASLVKNKFWQSDANGFAPLLFGMGASTLAFFPTRRAVLVEGPVDMLLYPTMFREVTKAAVVGFQFVPGLSAAAQSLAPLIPSAATHIGYLVDGDSGGQSLRDSLINGGVAPGRIIVLRNPDNSAVELEDFIDPVLLRIAANNLLRRFHPNAGQLDQSSFTLSHRMASLEVRYEAIAGVSVPKVELAYELLDLLDGNPSLRLLDRRREKAFSSIVSQVQGLFV